MLWIVYVLLAILLVWAVIMLLRTRVVAVIEVPQEERVVLYRFGQFSRLAGPGLVTLALYEREKRRINFRSEFGEYRTNTFYFINGIPFNYTISFWRRYDLVTAANGDRTRLAELVQYTDDERRHHLVTKLHEALYASVQVIQQKYPAPDEASIATKLLPILPGMPGCGELLALVKAELQRTLPTVGVIMDTLHPLSITNVHVTPEVIDSFGRGRSLAMLREQFPDLPADLLLQAFSAIEGLDMHTVRLYMNGGEVHEVKVEGEKVEGYKVTPTSAQSEQSRSPRRLPQPSPVESDEGEHLSKDDLRVLKRLPPAGVQRAAS